MFNGKTMTCLVECFRFLKYLLRNYVLYKCLHVAAGGAILTLCQHTSLSVASLIGLIISISKSGKLLRRNKCFDAWIDMKIKNVYFLHNNSKRGGGLFIPQFQFEINILLSYPIIYYMLIIIIIIIYGMCTLYNKILNSKHTYLCSMPSAAIFAFTFVPNKEKANYRLLLLLGNMQCNFL